MSNHLERFEKQLLIEFIMQADGPIVIRSSEPTLLNPILPNTTFLQGQKDEEHNTTYVIPGSSIKGVFRHYMEPTEGSYDDLFGGIRKKGRISFYDAYADLDTVKWRTKHTTEINSYTQGAREGTLNSVQMIERGDFQEVIRITNPLWKEIMSLKRAISAMNEGMIRIGGKQSTGFGCMKIRNITYTLTTYTEELQEQILYKGMHLEELQKAFHKRR
ncbi:RAMP superfamily CRISPR-associated protein [Anaerosporobacter sp.]|uniref:RAMP superfamily CRISPR-associated protein n=1 Tax=Anaerosporobacter sp. TaxID=1872529 RepID=UPI00286F7B24|nr:RAMP superfamily CRISPR-associated protein [Anaerosporobacter sp.]